MTDMGECGCYSGVEFAKFPGPDGGWYIIDIHTGCSGCDMPGGGISIRYVNKLEDYEEDIDNLPFTSLYEGCSHFSLELPTFGSMLRNLAKEAVREADHDAGKRKLLDKAKTETRLLKPIKGLRDILGSKPTNGEYQ